MRETKLLYQNAQKSKQLQDSVWKYAELGPRDGERSQDTPSASRPNFAYSFPETGTF